MDEFDFAALISLCKKQIEAYKDCEFEGLVSRLFTPNQSDDLNELVDLDALYQPYLPQNVKKLVKAWLHALFEASDAKDVESLSQNLARTMLLYKNKLAKEVSVFLYPQGELRAEFKDLILEPGGVSLGDYFQKMAKEHQVKDLSGKILQAYQFMVEQYLKTRFEALSFLIKEEKRVQKVNLDLMAFLASILIFRRPKELKLLLKPNSLELYQVLESLPEAKLLSLYHPSDLKASFLRVDFKIALQNLTKDLKNQTGKIQDLKIQSSPSREPDIMRLIDKLASDKNISDWVSLLDSIYTLAEKTLKKKPALNFFKEREIQSRIHYEAIIIKIKTFMKKNSQLENISTWSDSRGILEDLGKKEESSLAGELWCQTLMS